MSGPSHDAWLRSPSPIARALAAKDAGLTLEAAWRKYGGMMTLGEWRACFAETVWRDEPSDEPTT